MAEVWVATLDCEVEATDLESYNRKKGAWVPGDSKITSIPALACQISISFNMREINFHFVYASFAIFDLY